MPLRVLDGNQTATTLSSVVTGGEHIVAHTVVSLGPTAISNITSAVSGSVVSISNFPSTQTIAGTVTATIIDPDASLDAIIAGGINNFASNEVPLPISGTVTVGNSVTIGSLPAISGTVTANVPLSTDGYTAVTGVRVIGAGLDGGLRIQGIDPSDPGQAANLEEGGAIPVIGAYGLPLPISGTVTVGNSVTIGSLPAISGTVTANTAYATSVTGWARGGTVTAMPVALVDSGNYGGSIIGYNGTNSYLNTAIESVGGNSLRAGGTFPVSGTVTIGNSVTIGSLPAISGTVTAAAPNGSLTTRFGTPTTASVAFATSCVTNANRKYLLIQNVTTGSNVITVGIGFTPTTTQGIQLTAGAGITFESSYIPTGAVWVLSSVTASNFTILEG